MKKLYLLLICTLSLSPLSAQNILSVDFYESEYIANYPFNAMVVSDSSLNTICLTHQIGWTDMDPGPDTSYVGNPTRSLSYILSKFDAQNSLLWAYSINKKNRSNFDMLSLDLDQNNDLIVFGQGNNPDMNPDPSTVTRLDSNYRGYWLAKYDGDTGYLLWVFEFGEISYGNKFYDINTDPNTGKIYLVGEIKDSISIADRTGDVRTKWPSYQKDGFILSFDNDGKFDYFKNFEGLYDETFNSVQPLANGDYYLTGTFQTSFDLDPDSTGSYMVNSPAASKTEGFVARYDDDHHLVEGYQLGNVYDDNISQVFTNGHNDLALLGSFTDSVDFDIKDGTNQYAISRANNERFIAKYSEDLDFKWVTPIDDNPNLRIFDINLDEDGNILFGGYYSGPWTIGNYTVTPIKWTLTDFVCILESATGTVKYFESFVNNNNEESFVSAFYQKGNRYQIIGHGQDMIYTDQSGQTITHNTSPRSFFYIMTLDRFPTAVEVLDADPQLSLYPNPTDGMLHLELRNPDFRPTEMTIYDISGQMLERSPYHSALSVEQLPTGSYILSVSDGQHSHSEVFMKK